MSTRLCPSRIPARPFVLIALFALLYAIAAPASAQWPQGFESADAMPFQMMKGTASDGSTIENSAERAHGGSRSVKIGYRFNGKGYFQFIANKPAALPAGDKQRLRFWVNGAGASHFNSVALRLVDSKGETFQYNLPSDLASRLNGDGWREVVADIDLTKHVTHWGNNNDGVLDLPMRFLGFAMGRNAMEPAEGTIFLDDLSFAPADPAAPAAAAASMTLEPVWTASTPSIYIYPVGAAVSLRAGVTLPAGSAASEVTWKARDFDDAVVAQGRERIGGGAAQWTLPAGKPGILYIDADVRGAGDVVLAEARTRVAYANLATKPTPPQPFIWGIGSHPLRDAPNIEREAALMLGLGFSTLRGGVGSWLSVQPDSPDEWKWERTDMLLDILDRYGLKSIAGFLGTPRWATTGNLKAKDWRDWAYVSPRDQADLARYLTAAAKRYGDRVVAWEVWNEPDISFWRGTPEQYVTLFDTSIAAIKAGAPDARVMNGGFSETKRNPDFIPTYMKGVRRKPDIFAYHTHQQFSNLLRAAEDIENYRRDAGWGDVPVWMNEAGFSSGGRLTERDQTAALIKKFSYSAALGYEAYFWYDLRNDGTDPDDMEHNFGLVRRDFTPKAAAVATRTLTSVIGGKRYVRRLKTPESIYALLFEGKSETGGAQSALVVWNESPSGARTPLLLKAPSRAATITAMGVRADLPVQGGVAISSAGAMPEFVTIEAPAAGIDFAGDILSFDGSLPVAAGSTANWKLTLANPLSTPLRGEVRLAAGEGWTITPATQAFEIAPGAKQAMSVAVAAPAGAKTAALDIQVVSPALPGQIQAEARLLPALVVPRMPAIAPGAALSPGGTLAGSEPQARLGKGNLVSLFEATPMQELHFSGDADMSADVHLARIPAGLLVAVRVRDSVHAQKEAPGEEWKGDSLQLALALDSGAVYEWTTALGAAGPQATLSIAPTGVPAGPAKLPLSIRRAGGETVYEIVIPASLPGGAALPDSFRFSLLVNDNDGMGRKGWAEWTPGIGRSKDPSQYKSIVVR